MELPAGGGDWAIAVAIVTAAVLWFFKTPKEQAEEASDRITNLESKHHALDARFIAAEARLTAELRHLSNTIERLIHVMQNGNDHNERVSGRHPNLG